MGGMALAAAEGIPGHVRVEQEADPQGAGATVDQGAAEAEERDRAEHSGYGERRRLMV